MLIIITNGADSTQYRRPIQGVSHQRRLDHHQTVADILPNQHSAEEGRLVWGAVEHLQYECRL
jgi:hypothetical protein